MIIIIYTNDGHAHPNITFHTHNTYTCGHWNDGRQFKNYHFSGPMVYRHVYNSNNNIRIKHTHTHSADHINNIAVRANKGKTSLS